MSKFLNNKLILSLIAVFFLTSFFGVAFAQTTPSRQIDVSAYIMGGDDTELDNGRYSVRFAIYSRNRETVDPYPSNSDPKIWEETQEVEINNGILNAYLGANTSLPESLDFSSNSYYLGIRIGTDSEMTPRKKIAAIPLAINAFSLQGATPGTKEGNILQLGKGGVIEESIIPELTVLGTVDKGAWEADPIESDFIGNALSGKTYNGLTFTSNADGFSIEGGSISRELTLTGGDVILNAPGTVGSIAYSNGTGYAFSAAGTAGQVLLSGGSGAPTWGSAAGLSQWIDDASGIHYSAGNVGIGTDADASYVLKTDGTASGSGDVYFGGSGGGNLIFDESSLTPGRWYIEAHDELSNQLGEIDFNSGSLNLYAYEPGRSGESAAELFMDYLSFYVAPSVDASGALESFRFNADYSNLNTAGDGYTALKLDVTDAQGGADGNRYLMDLQVGSVSKFAVNSAGNVGIGAVPSQALFYVHGSDVLVDPISDGNAVAVFDNPGGEGVNVYLNALTGQSDVNYSFALDGALRGGFRYNVGGDYLALHSNGAEVMFIGNTGNIGIGDASPSAYLQIKGGTDAAGTAPLKLTAGTNLTDPEDGAFEYDGTELYFTPSGATRETVAYLSDLSGIIETDPIFSGSAAFGIAAGDITNWDTAYGWGDHSVFGYITDLSTFTTDNLAQGSTNIYSQWITAGSDIYYNTGSVGLGVDTPQERLHIAEGTLLIDTPSNPTLESRFDTSGSAWEVYVSGKYAYVADDISGLQIIDVSDPASPDLVSTFDTVAAGGVYVSGQYAYVADHTSGLLIIDVSNPFSPSLVGSYDTSDSAGGVYVVGRYAYVSDSDSGLQIVDISDPTAPTLAGSYDTDGNAYGVYVSGKYAYVADFAAGLKIVDVSDPASPTLAGSLDTDGYAFGVYVSGRYAYVGDDLAGLKIVDISNPASPALIGTYDTNFPAQGVYVSGKYAYIGNDNDGLLILDISNPAAPVFVGSYDTVANSFGVFVSGTHVYVCDELGGLYIIDIGGADIHSLYAGNIETGSMVITENVDIGSNLYVRSGINSGVGGIMTDGKLSVSGIGYFGGNVGIGTANPGASLELGAAVGADSNLYLSDGDVAHGMTSFAPTNVYGKIGIQNSTGGGLNIMGFSDQNTTPLNITGYLPSGGVSAAGMIFKVGQRSGGSAIALSDTQTAFQFLNYGAELITILGSGNVGIGTDNPSSLLDLQLSGTAKADNTLLEITNSTNAADMDATLSSILFNQWYYDASTPAVADAGRISFGTETDWTSTASTQDSYLSFSTALDGTVSEKMWITSGGNVGIGTANPGAYGLYVTNQILSESHITGATFAASGGTESIPSFRFVGDDVGMWSSGADTLNFSTGGAEKMRITSAGYVGIGTNNPGEKLEVNGNIDASGWIGTSLLASYSPDDVGRNGSISALNNVYFNIDSNNDDSDSNSFIFAKNNSGSSGTELMRISEAGNVGIGDTTPDNLLEILSAGAANTQFTISNTNAGDYNPQIGFELADGTNLFTMGIDDSDSDKFKIYSGTSISGTSEFTIDSTGLVSIANLEMGAQVFADDAGAISWIDMGVVSAVDNTVESYSAQLDGNNILTIYGLSDGSGGVDNLGVGIGTTAPSSLLDLEKVGTVKANTDLLEITNSGNAADMDATLSSILFNQWYYDASAPAVADSGRITFGTEADWTSTVSTQDSYLAFQTSLNGTVAEKMRITSGGNVGIGMTPTARLHLAGVAGTVSFEVNSNETTAGNNVLALRSDVAGADDLIFRVQADGAVFADGAYTGTGADYAEYFETSDTDLESGEAVCLDPEKENAVKRCVRTGDNNLMGVVSSNPSIVGNSADGRDKDSRYKIVAMLGQIRGRISSENGVIQIGDSLTSAIIPGYLRKADPGESTVGVALQNFSGEQGSIQILISRKNKSLTVEKVEEAVSQRIAEMDVQDQVDSLIAEARTGLDEAMLTLSSGIDARILNLTAIIEAQMDEIRADNRANLNAILQNSTDINILTAQVASILGPDPMSISSRIERLEILSQLSSRNLENGGIEITIIDPAAPTIGESVIPAGESLIMVNTKAVTADSKIYITPIGSTDNQVIYVGSVEEAVGFEVKVDRITEVVNMVEVDGVDTPVSTPVVPKEIKFDWWIVSSR